MQQRLYEIETRRHTLGHGHLAEDGMWVVVKLGGGLGKVCKWLDHCALHFVDLIEHVALLRLCCSAI